MTQTLVDAGETLADILIRENDALSRLDFAAAVALVPAKQAALITVTECVPAPRPADGHPALTALGQRLNALAVENRALLERAINVQTRIVGIIVQAVATPAGGSASTAVQYGADGSKSPQRRRPAIALSARA